MRSLIIDVGCSNLKMGIYDNESLMQWYKTITPRDINETIEILKSKFHGVMREHQPNNVMVISYSDSIIYEMKDGKIGTIAWDAEIPRRADVPDYQVSGKPINSQLIGMAQQLMHLKESVGLAGIDRILPPSTYFASALSGNDAWRKWDITHATNSGMWDYKRATWAKEMSPFLEAGIVDYDVAACNEYLWTEDKYFWLVGGMDTVFVNATDTPYSSKPYLSCGTWVTASVESYFRKRDRRSPTRFVSGPNGTILEQLCFRGDTCESKMVYQHIYNFFEKRFGDENDHPAIKVFGVWSPELLKVLKKHPYLKFVSAEPDGGSFLHEQAIRYMMHPVAPELYIPHHAEGFAV